MKTCSNFELWQSIVSGREPIEYYEITRSIKVHELFHEIGYVVSISRESELIGMDEEGSRYDLF
jgi:hypothetical protein